ncbi:hypothetical protein Tco_0637486, partial [Tanacetum coccineum]
MRKHNHSLVLMVDDVTAPFAGASRPRPSSCFVPSFRDVFEDAIHVDFFSFLLVLIMQLTLKVVLLGIACLLARSGMLPSGQLLSVVHCMMMSHGGELLARYRGLLQSHHEYVLSADSRLKGYEERVVDASFSKSKAKGKERKKKFKSLTKSLDNLHAECLHPSFVAKGPSRVQGELLSLAASAGFERGLSMHQTKDEFAAVLKKMAHYVLAHRVVIMEYLVNISKRHTFWSLNEEIFKITILKTNTSYPSRKIQ